MATWAEMSIDNRRSEQNLLDAECYRSSISRACYAAYCAVTSQLAGRVTFPFGGNNPSHPDLPALILNNLPDLPPHKRREVKQAVSRLWSARVEADYVPDAYIDRSIALDVLRDAARVLSLLEIKKMSEQQIVELVQQYLHPIEDVMAVEILEQSVHREGAWWYVPVRLVEPKLKTYRYYGELAEVESDLKEHENINVLLVPSG